MALPTLDAVFASAADQPRRYMLAKWLVGEKGEVAGPSSVLVSGAGSSSINGTYTERGTYNGKPYYNIIGEPDDFSNLAIFFDGLVWKIRDETQTNRYISEENVAFPWLDLEWDAEEGLFPAPTVTEIPASNPIANYITLPERYLWAKIAVAAGAPRSEADYISLPKQYAWSDIYNSVAGLIPPSSVLVSGAGTTSSNGTYTLSGQENGKNRYVSGSNVINWDGSNWLIYEFVELEDVAYISSDDVEFPWQVTTWSEANGSVPNPTVTKIPQPTPNHTDWSEKQALGHIAAAYRGDTANPANLATYIDWPWRYQVASIIDGFYFSFSKVSLLLHMDGEEDSQAFIDSSLNNLDLTAYGNAKINTTTKKFGSGSASFDGDGDYILVSQDPSLDMGTEDFTIEYWAYLTENTKQYPVHIATTSSYQQGVFGMGFNRSDYLNKIWVFYDAAEADFFHQSEELSLNQWYHIAVTRKKTIWRAFVNGIQFGYTEINQTNTVNLALGGAMGIGGSSWDGEESFTNDYIDELRIIKGIAIYTGNFTPSTEAFPNQ